MPLTWVLLAMPLAVLLLVRLRRRGRHGYALLGSLSFGLVLAVAAPRLWSILERV
jgi:hypothetical protein